MLVLLLLLLLMMAKNGVTLPCEGVLLPNLNM
jgi:hypothetical protein